MRNLHEIYGLYDIPKEILQLIQLEEELTQMDLSLDIIGLNPIQEEYFYSITPLDCIPFVNTGGDGIHFGFLTDFGEVTDLYKAPIACVTPTNDPPIRYIARNLHDFLSLAYSVPHAEMLESFWNYENEEQIQLHIQEFLSYSSPDWEQKRTAVLSQFQQTFQLEKINVLNYLIKAKQERAQSIKIPTLDGLGIAATSTSIENPISYSLRDKEHHSDEKLHLFLETARREEKLAFIRNTMYTHILDIGFVEKERDLVVQLLKELGLSMEQARFE